MFNLLKTYTAKWVSGARAYALLEDFSLISQVESLVSKRLGILGFHMQVCKLNKRLVFIKADMFMSYHQLLFTFSNYLALQYIHIFQYT